MALVRSYKIPMLAGSKNNPKSTKAIYKIIEKTIKNGFETKSVSLSLFYNFYDDSTLSLFTNINLLKLFNILIFKSNYNLYKLIIK